MSSCVSARRLKEPNKQLTPWSKVIIKKLTVPKAVMKHPLLWKLNSHYRVQ